MSALSITAFHRAHKLLTYIRYCFKNFVYLIYSLAPAIPKQITLLFRA